MTRKLSVLILIALFVTAMVGTQAFAAKANNGTSLTGNVIAKDYARAGWRGGAGEELNSIGFPSKPATFNNTSLGFNLYFGNLINTTGTTSYDLPSNQTLPTTVIEADCGSGLRVHGFYMNITGADPRVISQYYYQTDASPVAPTTTDISGGGGGFPSIDFKPSGIGVGAWHNVALGGTRVAEEFSCQAGVYSAVNYPATLNTTPPGPTATDGEYIWPSACVDPIGGGDYFVHVIAHETPPTGDASGYQTMVYWRSDTTDIVTSQPDANLVEGVSSISGTVVQDPNSPKVAIIYAKPRLAGMTNPDTLYANDDVYYYESTTNGDDWASGTFGSPQLIHSFSNDSLPDGAGGFVAGYWERAWETTGLYTSDGCLNVAFMSVWSDTGFGDGGYGTGGYVLIYPGALYHWSDCRASGNAVKITGDNLYGTLCSGNLGAGLALRNIGKINLSECSSTGNIYATYNRNLNNQNGDGTPVDCSDGGAVNQEIVIRASSTGGDTWGNEINITDTQSDGCTVGNCMSELHLGTVRYNTDTITVAFLEDKDAGISIGASGFGATTTNPVMNLRIPCFEMQEFVELEASPAEFRYPFNTTPNTATSVQTSTITNFGNIPTNPTVTVNYISGAGWLNVTSGGSLNIPAGETNTADLTFIATGPATEGLYQAEINLDYDDGTALAAPAQLTIPVDLYTFSTFCLPENGELRTGLVRMDVNQVSEVADATPGKSFTYFSDAESYIFDGFLVMGNSATNLTYSTFGGGGTTSPDPTDLPGSDNPYGYLYAVDCATTVDSTGQLPNYRVATGKGTNRDSTIEFLSSYYCTGVPGAVDNTSEFYFLKFELYAGANFGGTINDLNIGYYVDWDVPSDTGSDNNSAVSAADYALIQQGSYTQDVRWGAMAAYSDAGGAVAGKVFDNPTYIYPFSGFENDTLWNWFDDASGVLPNGTFQVADSTDEDLSSLVITHRGASLAAGDTLRVYVFLAAEDADASGGANSDDILGTIDEAIQFACDNNLAPEADFCQGCACGDADGNGQISITDAVYIINYIFGGGPAPNPICQGDADGNQQVSITDAVYIINYIFGGGPAPGGC